MLENEKIQQSLRLLGHCRWCYTDFIIETEIFGDPAALFSAKSSGLRPSGDRFKKVLQGRQKSRFQ
jgi:hypothetical protein